MKTPFGSFVSPVKFEGEKPLKSPIPSAFLPMVSKVGILFGMSGDTELFENPSNIKGLWASE